MYASQGSVEVRTRRSAEDVDLENRIANFLYQQNVPDSARIHTDAQVGTVIVSGNLPSRLSKWLCVECCRRVAGVARLVDRVVVDDERLSESGSRRSSSD